MFVLNNHVNFSDMKKVSSYSWRQVKNTIILVIVVQNKRLKIKKLNVAHLNNRLTVFVIILRKCSNFKIQRKKWATEGEV